MWEVPPSLWQRACFCGLFLCVFPRVSSANKTNLRPCVVPPSPRVPRTLPSLYFVLLFCSRYQVDDEQLCCDFDELQRSNESESCNFECQGGNQPWAFCCGRFSCGVARKRKGSLPPVSLSRKEEGSPPSSRFSPKRPSSSFCYFPLPECPTPCPRQLVCKWLRCDQKKAQPGGRGHTL